VNDYFARKPFGELRVLLHVITVVSAALRPITTSVSGEPDSDAAKRQLSSYYNIL